MPTLFPPEIIENTVECYHAQISTRSKVIYGLIKKLVCLLLISVSSLYGQNIPQNSKDSTYFANTLRSFIRGNNTHRCRFVKNYTTNEGLLNLTVKTESIDWLGIYRNVIVEKKGESDSIVYVVCHYDKIDGNITSAINTLINGSLDVLLSNIYLSKGAYDNGTGVVTSLGLLYWINSQDTHYTYRFLFAGMEEYGLRGSRRHVSGLKKSEWKKCFYAVNIDMVGKKGINGVTVTQNISDSNLIKISEGVTDYNKVKLIKSKMPVGASSDYYSFSGQSFIKDFGVSIMANLTGAFIPQRSYFTANKKGIPVIDFSDDSKISMSELVSIYSPVSFGEIHSFRDNPNVVDVKNLVTYNTFLKSFLLSIDHQKSLISNYNSSTK
jgi:hypothetical protein